MKNYTLYFKIGSSMIPIFKGTLKEIDSFTSAFENEDKLGECIIKNYESSQYNGFVLKSSKNNEYKILYSRFSAASVMENSDLIINYLKNQDKDYLLSFLEKYTKIVSYINDGKNLSRVPVYRLYSAISSENQRVISYELDKFIKEDYKNYRQVSIGILSENEELPFITKKIDKEYVDSIVKTIKAYKQIDYDDFIEKMEELDEISSSRYEKEDRISDILNSDYMDMEEKIDELGFICEEDELRKLVNTLVNNG